MEQRGSNTNKSLGSVKILFGSVLWMTRQQMDRSLLFRLQSERHLHVQGFEEATEESYNSVNMPPVIFSFDAASPLGAISKKPSFSSSSFIFSMRRFENLRQLVDIDPQTDGPNHHEAAYAVPISKGAQDQGSENNKMSTIARAQNSSKDDIALPVHNVDRNDEWYF
ncbi:hypothetical protein AXG93_1923s1780 [Marchantia polymorpha subsp. ruderalis]|uniref:Uncharacterized protein n=1 Tax=Marchantia polymorpha subsp. ruderalis TaxID=1480154 RepID=A0A176VE74_MARPO|nr:hypothetical protein AXG93_1923s1780 [Marchantia polymorpha subsp. ruderalis]